MASLTNTQKQQLEVEEKVEVLLRTFASASTHHHHSALLELWRDQHVEYLLHGFQYLGPSFSVLDASRPWLCYWILHSLALLGHTIDPLIKKQTVDFLARCQDPEGGYGGGPGQMPHLATTYAAVSTLVTIGGNEALGSINRKKVFQFLLRMKDSSGGFRVHDNGEVDVRGCYTAIAVAHMLDIVAPALVHKVADYVVSCQSYEGGIGGEPSAEAHGGYTYCGLAALVLLNQAHLLDLPRLVNWAVFRQGKIEGGFQGRVNKLVDGCYSFWQGGIFPLIQRLSEHIMLQSTETSPSPKDSPKSDSVEHLLNETGHGTSEVDIKETSGDVDCHRDAAFKLKRDRRDAPSVPFNEVIHTNSIRVKAEMLFPAKSVEWRTFAGDISESSNTQRSKVPVSVSNSLIALNFSEATQAGVVFNAHALQGYILLCCQVFNGGLRDKPGKPCDYYHTCYCLSGLSIAQYSGSKQLGTLPPPNAVIGPYDNLLEPTHPLCNVVLEKYYSAHSFFENLPLDIY